MENKRRLIIEIQDELHHIVKKRALNKKLSLKDWLLIAIANQIREEDNLEKKNG